MVEGGVGGCPIKFLRAEAEHPAGSRVHERDPSFGVRAENALGARFEDEPRALFGLPSFLALQGEAERVGHRLGDFLQPGGFGFRQRLEETQLHYPQHRFIGREGVGEDVGRGHRAKAEMHAESFRVRDR